MKLRAAALSIALSLTLGAGARPARAEEPAPAKTEARERFAQGLRLFEKGENAAALAEFERAYALVPNPVVLYDIGLVYAAMDRPVEAVDALDKFLAAGGSAVAGEQALRARQTRAEQAARVAMVNVTANQPALIEIDGVEAGRTPLEHPLRVASGAHVISAQAPGYLPLRHEVTLAGQVTATLTFTLLPAESTAAHLTISVAVPGAEIIVNGKSVGASPLTASVAVTPGTVTIEARRSGYLPATRSVRADEGSSGALALPMDEDPAAPAALKGRIRVTTSEPGAEITIDGAARTPAGGALTLMVGPHDLRVERAGFVPAERRIDVVAGGETRIAVALAPTPESRARADESAQTRRNWGWAAVGTGVALAGGLGIYAAVTHNDVPNAQAGLNTWLGKEANPSDLCYGGASNQDNYVALQCGVQKSYYQDQVDSAKLRRGLAYGGIGLGAVAAGVGIYLLSSAGRGFPIESAASVISLWTDGSSGGLLASGRF